MLKVRDLRLFLLLGWDWRGNVVGAICGTCPESEGLSAHRGLVRGTFQVKSILLSLLGSDHLDQETHLLLGR